MKGLDLYQEYYMEYGIPMIDEKFTEYAGRIAVGVVGPGSECYGFDDSISIDHDFGPSFCMWLTDHDYEMIGKDLEIAYADLPEYFMGHKRIISSHGGGRVGVFRIGDFYKKYTGKKDGSLTLSEWIHIPENLLAEATNGRVFRDDLGEFSKIRSILLNYYPEDVRIKKIASRAAAIAQSGQYNYSRSMRRKEIVAARFAIDEFIKNTISMVYLLNKEYQPYYKWAHRGMENLIVLPEARNMIEELVLLPVQIDAWKGQSDYWNYSLNTNDRAVELMENLCDLIANELFRQELTEVKDTFLENHIASIMSKIENMRIRSMHVLVG